MGDADRYGQTRVAKIRAAYNDLREAVARGDMEAAQASLDRYEQWADFALRPDVAADRAAKLAEALARLCNEMELPGQRGVLHGVPAALVFARDALRDWEAANG